MDGARWPRSCAQLPWPPRGYECGRSRRVWQLRALAAWTARGAPTSQSLAWRGQMRADKKVWTASWLALRGLWRSSSAHNSAEPHSAHAGRRVRAAWCLPLWRGERWPRENRMSRREESETQAQRRWLVADSGARIRVRHVAERESQERSERKAVQCEYLWRTCRMWNGTRQLLCTQTV